MIDRVPGGPCPAAGEPDGADAAGHGGDVPGGPGGPGRAGLPPSRGTWAGGALLRDGEALDFLSTLIDPFQT